MAGLQADLLVAVHLAERAVHEHNLVAGRQAFPLVVNPVVIVIEPSSEHSCNGAEGALVCLRRRKDELAPLFEKNEFVLLVVGGEHGFRVLPRSSTRLAACKPFVVEIPIVPIDLGIEKLRKCPGPGSIDDRGVVFLHRRNCERLEVALCESAAVQLGTQDTRRREAVVEEHTFRAGRVDEWRLAQLVAALPCVQVEAFKPSDKRNL